ncbi:MAG: ATP-binding protein [Tepidisphaeraceae bacterium]|jgi:two-component system sensor histidine kinase QseC
MNSSLRSRLLVGTAVVTVFAVAGAAVAIYFSVRASLVAEFDASLTAHAHALASLTEQTPKGIVVEIDPLMMPEFSRADRPDYFALWSAGAAPIALSSAVAGNLRKPASSLAAGHPFSLALPDGRPGRAIVLTFPVHMEEPDDTITRASDAAMLTLLLARETAGMDRMLSGLSILLAGVALATAVVSGGLMTLVIRRGLSPVGDLAARIASLGENTLAERLHAPSVPVELLPMVDRLNELLSRLDAAFTRERAFSADVAHELRTPLAGLESALEVCASRRREPDAYEQTVTRCLAAVRDMHAMVERLLLLARFESGQVSISPQLAVLCELAADCLRSFQARIAARRLQVAVSIPSDLSVRTDPQHLRIILHNLLDNAVAYAGEGGIVRMTAVNDEAHTVIQISNTGSTLTSADAEKAFERFWRADAARGNTGLHCGLGLSLSRRIAQCLSGSLTATSVPGGCFEVTLTLGC